jgi:ABC-type sugar transport system ATPase subunit
MVEGRGPLLRMTGIDKRFGGVHALRSAELSVERGEILGLCGENGAGKSTLLKVLSGVHPWGSYQGQIRLDGAELELRDTRDAQRAGIAIVHQELMLVPELSVTQNLLLGREPRRLGLLDEEATEAKAHQLLARFGFDDEIDPARPLGDLGIGLQQIVEIVRALSYDARILVLDEPTAALNKREAERLLSWLRTLRESGTTSIYVSHRLDEVFALCDRITVMRDGRTAGTVVTRETTPEAVIDLMVGRALQARGPSVARPSQDGLAPALETKALSVRVPGDKKRFALEDVSIAVRPGEVLAIAGAMGSGRTALLSTLFGCAQGAVSGTIVVGGEAVRFAGPAAAIARGVVLLPEDRKGSGVVLDMTVAENLALPWLADSMVMGAGAAFWLVDGFAERALAERRIRELRIRGDADAPVATLSGGNQQKVVLGKWLERPPKVLLLDEPTRGVDVGAREEIYAILGELTAKGVAVLLASSDLPELLRLAHRIVVLRHGRVAGELDPASATEANIAALSTGASRESLPDGAAVSSGAGP